MIREKVGRIYYRRAYAGGHPHWDTGQVPELLAGVLAGMRPGRVLDLGCGTGTAAVHLASLGWQVVGVDFAEAAIDAARRRAAAAGVSVDLRVGDVTQLGGVVGTQTFDLILDVGCYHGLSPRGRERYAAGVARAAAAGATLLVYGFRSVPGVWRLIGAPEAGTADVEDRFAPWFAVEAQGSVPAGKRAGLWLRLRRRNQPGTRSIQPDT